MLLWVGILGGFDFSSRLDFIFDVDSMGVVRGIVDCVTFCRRVTVCSTMVGGMVVAIVDRDDMTMVLGAVLSCCFVHVLSCCRPLLLMRLAVPRTNCYHC